MRFIYIDSQGKEVVIPTVEALALRIELGAITEATRFYDANADRWAPAGEHEIFRSLTREVAAKSGGFVAPPPPTPVTPPPPVAGRPPVPSAPASAKKAPNPFEALEGPGEPPPPPPSPKAAQPAGDPFGLDFGLTLPPPPAEPTPSPAADRSVPDPFGAEFTPMALEPEAPAEKERKEEERTSGFGGFGGLLSEDEDEDQEDEAPASPPSDLGVAGATSGAGLDPTGFGQGARVAADHGMEMEKPLADLPFDTGGWMQKEEPPPARPQRDQPDPTLRYRSHDDEPSAEQTKRPERPERPAPPAAPPPKEKSNIGALVGVLVVVLLVGAGGWFGWTKYKNRPAPVVVEAEPAEPPVQIPELAESLQPRMRELSTAAKTDWLAMIRTGLPAEKGLAVEPDPEWLGGSYLADASKYAIVEQYWKGLDGYLTDLQARDETLFVNAVTARMDTIAAQDSASALSAADREALSNRLRAGFQASRADRRAVYNKLQAVIDAALGLHAFLLQNEDKISYDPAAGGASRDPILEAVPESPELGRQMGDRVDQITESLDGLGALDKVTTDRLLELFSGQLGAVPIR